MASSAYQILHNLAEAMFEAPDPGDAGTVNNTDRLFKYIPLTTAAAETRTLPDPEKAGLLLALHMIVDGGDCVVTADTAINGTGNNTITFDAVGDFIFLVAVRQHSATPSYRWQEVATVDAALSTV